MKSRGDMVLIAMQYYGQSAIPGGRSNPVVEGFFQKSNHREITDDDVPWCSAFLNAIAHLSDAPYTDNLMAKSWLSTGQVIDSPQFGDIAVFDWTLIGDTGGHVGIVIAKFEDLIYILGGNQDNKVEIKAFRERCVVGYRRLLD